MNTHLLRTYTDESLVEKYKNKYHVTVAWTIDFKDELLPSLDVLHKNYAVDPNKLKRGVGSLIVEISSDAIQSEKIAAFVGEVLAVTQILDENGVNAFGFEIETSVIRHQMAVEVSQDLSLKLLTGIDLDIDSLPSEEHTSFGLALSSAAYLFGCNFTTGTDHSWAQPYINESNKFDYNNAIRGLRANDAKNHANSVSSLFILKLIGTAFTATSVVMVGLRDNGTQHQVD